MKRLLFLAADVFHGEVNCQTQGGAGGEGRGGRGRELAFHIRFPTIHPTGKKISRMICFSYGQIITSQEMFAQPRKHEATYMYSNPNCISRSRGSTAVGRARAPVSTTRTGCGRGPRWWTRASSASRSRTSSSWPGARAWRPSPEGQGQGKGEEAKSELFESSFSMIHFQCKSRCVSVGAKI